LLTHLRFRQSIGRETIEALPLRLRAHPLPTLASLAAIAAIALSTFWVDGLRYTLPTFAPFLLVMSVVYVRYRDRYKINRV
jgi:AAT family amino acid transporter